MKTHKFAILAVMIVVSFFGFLIENTFTFFRTGTINNRNMIFPFLFGYGMAIAALYAFFGTPESPHFFGIELKLANQLQNTIFYFAMSFICVCVGEIALGYATEWICGIKWWDYSSIPLSITQYTSVPTSAAFAFLITLFMGCMWKPMIEGFMNIEPKTLINTSVAIAVILSLDMINSGLYMLTQNTTLVLWEYKADKPLSEILINVLS